MLTFVGFLTELERSHQTIVIRREEVERLACISHKLDSASARNVRQRYAIGDLASAPGMTA